VEPSSNVQPKLSKLTSITCVQNASSTTSNILIIPLAPIEQDLEFWNSFEGCYALTNMMSKYEKGPSIVTHMLEVINFPTLQIAI
jgi:hypothetical protein